MTGWNLPPGCSVRDIDENAGAFFKGVEEDDIVPIKNANGDVCAWIDYSESYGPIVYRKMANRKRESMTMPCYWTNEEIGVLSVLIGTMSMIPTWDGFWKKMLRKDKFKGLVR